MSDLEAPKSSSQQIERWALGFVLVLAIVWPLYSLVKHLDPQPVKQPSAEFQSPISLDQAQSYQLVQIEDTSVHRRQRVRAFIYSKAVSRAARVQTSMKAAVEVLQDTGVHFVQVFLLISPDTSLLGTGSYYANLSFAPDGGGVSGEKPLRNGQWEAQVTDQVVDPVAVEMEKLWWANRGRFQKPADYGGTETDEPALRGFIAEELGVQASEVSLVALWLEPYQD